MNAPSLTPQDDTPVQAVRPSIGKRIYSFLLDPEVKGNLQGPIESFIACLILLNVASMLIEQVPAVFEPNRKWFHFFDTVSIIVFTAEYVIRFALSPYQKGFSEKRFPRISYALSPFAVVDLLSILPFYLSAFIALDLRVLRVLRLLRLLKLFRVLIPAWKEFRELNRGRTFRQHVHAIVWPSRFGGQIHNFFDLFIIVWVVLSVVSVLLETVESVHYIMAMEFAVLDSVAVAVFTTEYLMRIYSCVEDPRFKGAFTGRAGYAFTPGAVIDALAVAPFFLEALLHHLFDLRFLRIFRMLRLLKLTRFSDATKMVWDGIKREAGTIGASFFVLLLVIILCGSVGYLLEHAAQPDKFESIPTSIYWSVITLSSVGYGDISPIMASGASDTDERALLEDEAKRLHITADELDLMISTAHKARMRDDAVRAEFNLNAASQDGQLAFEQFRTLVSQMKQIVLISDQNLAGIIGSETEASGLEKAIYEHIASQKAATPT